MSPVTGYSSLYGFYYGLDGRADFEIAPQWQLGVGGGLALSDLESDKSKFELVVGPTYNFSEDFSNSFFVGFGVGYSNRYPTFEDTEKAFGYVDFGKRFLISEEYNLSYKPTVSVRYSEGKSSFMVSPLSFSMSF
ncbi:MAG TPA: hypothetical protein DCL41_11305 [Bdellovibrionales bacterium]|nr:hypothetical protein [Pseudobdellovibrionaceae bacterium]HAG92454.1 hypothetical protein [Bdellovibrionales bacterium]